MSVHGSLRTMPLPELLMWVSQYQKTGTLELKTSDFDGRIAFDKGFLIFSSSSDLHKTFGRLLINRGLLSEEQHAQARRVREEQRIALAKVLRDLHLLPEEDIIRLLRKKAESEIFELFRKDDGEFRFLDGEVPDIDLLPMRVDVAKAMMRITQQIDENGDYDFDSSGIRLDMPPV